MLQLQLINGFRCYEGDFVFDTSNTGVSDYIVIPPDGDRISVQLYVISTASVTVQATVSSQSAIESDTAVWKDWDNGAVTGGAVSQDSTKGPVAAIRISVNTALAGNNAVLSVRVQKGSPQ